MPKKILVPVDVNHIEPTKAMMKQIGELTGNKDTQLVLLNVIPEIPGYVAIQLPEDVLKDAAKDAQASLKLLASTHGVESQSTIQIAQGNPAQQILQTAQNEDVELIVIGSHQPGLTDYLIGSVAARVVRHAKCSVLVVR